MEEMEVLIAVYYWEVGNLSYFLPLNSTEALNDSLFYAKLPSMALSGIRMVISIGDSTKAPFSMHVIVME